MIVRTLFLGLLLLPAAAAADPAELFAPVEVGGELSPGWELDDVEAVDDAIMVRLNPGGTAPALAVRLTLRDEDSGAFCRTKSFNIVYLTEGGEGGRTPEEIHHALDALCRLVKQNDRGQIELERFAGPVSASPGVHWRWPGWSSLLVLLLLGVLAAVALFTKPVERAAAWAGAAVERFDWLVLAVMLVPLAVLRFCCLDIPFDADYMTQRVFFGSLGIGDILAHDYQDQRHPQLFYLVLHFFLYFGHQEWLMRLPAVLFSLGSAVALFALARPYLGGLRSLLCVLLLMLSTSFFEHSRDVSDLSLFIMLALLACHLFLRCLKEPGTRLLIVFAAVETLMFYAYYMAVLVLFAQLVIVMVFARSKKFFKLWIALGAACLLAVPAFWDLVALVLADVGTRQVAGQFPAHVWGEQAVMQMLSDFAALVVPATLFGVLTPVMVLAGAWRWGRRAWKRPEFLLLVVLLVVSLVVIGLAVVLVRLRPYYLLFLLPPYLMLVVAGCLGLPGSGLRIVRAVGWVVMGLMVFVHAGDLAWRAPRIMSAEGREHFSKVGQVVRQGGADTVVADPDMMHTILIYYCFPRPLEIYRQCRWHDRPVHCRLGSERLVSLTGMSRMRAGWEQEALARIGELEGLPFWFVYTDRFENRPLLDHLRGTCSVRGGWGPLTLFLCPASHPETQPNPRSDMP
jgi:hypothetical protein